MVAISPQNYLACTNETYHN